MRTTCALTVSPSVLYGGGVSALGGVCSGGVSALGVSAPGGVYSWGVCLLPGGVCLMMTLLNLNSRFRNRSTYTWSLKFERNKNCNIRMHVGNLHFVKCCIAMGRKHLIFSQIFKVAIFCRTKLGSREKNHSNYILLNAEAL